MSGGKWEGRDVSATVAFKAVTTAVRLSVPTIASQASAQVWYETHCAAALDALQPSVRRLLDSGPGVALEAIASGVVAAIHAELTAKDNVATAATAPARFADAAAAAAAVAAASAGSSASVTSAVSVPDSKTFEATVQATLDARRKTIRTLADAAVEAAGGAFDEAKLAHGLGAEQARLREVLSEAYGATVVAELRLRRAELFAAIRAAVAGLQLKYRYGPRSSQRERIVILDDKINGAGLDASDAGGLWMVVCRECFLPHPLLTAARARQNFMNSAAILAARQEMVTERFAAEAHDGKETLQSLARRLVWHRHAYEQVGQALNVPAVVLRLDLFLTSQQMQADALWSQIAGPQYAALVGVDPAAFRLLIALAGEFDERFAAKQLRWSKPSGSRGAASANAATVEAAGAAAADAPGCGWR